MTNKTPIVYKLTPRTVPDAGVYWLTLHLQNKGEQTLYDLDVKLNSLDTGCIRVLGRGTFIPRVDPGEEQLRHFQASIQATEEVYVSVDGKKDGETFHWEGPGIPIQVGGQPAELVSLFALNEPPARLGEPIVCEAVVRGVTTSSNLVLEFWAEMPSGELRSLKKEGIGRLTEKEEARYRVELTPEEGGIYILHAYLYQGARRIGHRAEYLSIAL